MITCLNVFPYKYGISRKLTPTVIILWSPNTYHNKPKITFGAYANVYIGNTNSKKRRTLEDIAIRPSNNCGGYYFISLAIGENINALSCTKLPINYQVIERVNDLPLSIIRQKLLRVI